MTPPAEPSQQTPALLVPLDGSAAGEAALPVAHRLAKALGAPLYLLRVVQHEAGIVEARAYLAALAGDDPTTRVEIRSGGPAEEIAAAAAESSDSLVVLSTIGEGEDPHHLGSVAGRLSRTLANRALFVPSAAADTTPLSGPVIVALHGSQASEAGIEQAVALATALGTSLTLVQVAPWAEGLFANFLGLPPPNADAEIELGSNNYLSGHVAKLEGRLPVEYQTLRGRAASMLVEYADSVGGWLVLASHAHHGPHVWGLGSTADKVLRASRVPVLIVRVGEDESAAP